MIGLDTQRYHLTLLTASCWFCQSSHQIVTSGCRHVAVGAALLVRSRPSFVDVLAPFVSDPTVWSRNRGHTSSSHLAHLAWKALVEKELSFCLLRRWNRESEKLGAGGDASYTARARSAMRDASIVSTYEASEQQRVGFRPVKLLRYRTTMTILCRLPSPKQKARLRIQNGDGESEPSIANQMH